MANEDGSLTVGERLRSIETKIDTLSTIVQRDVAKSHADFERMKNFEQRLTDLEGWQTWAMRIVGALVITGLLSLVIINQ